MESACRQNCEAKLREPPLSGRRGALSNNQGRPLSEPLNYILPKNTCRAPAFVEPIPLHPRLQIRMYNIDKTLQNFCAIFVTQNHPLAAIVRLQIFHRRTTRPEWCSRTPRPWLV